jgi:hypothetical protein
MWKTIQQVFSAKCFVYEFRHPNYAPGTQRVTTQWGDVLLVARTIPALFLLPSHSKILVATVK